MTFLPYENFYIITNLKPEAVQQRLEAEISPGDGSFFKFGMSSSSTATYFEGFAVNGTFKFKRVISYRNSFLPQIEGTTEVYPSGSRVHVKMKMYLFVVIFMCLWICPLGLATIWAVVRAIVDKHIEPNNFVPFAMMLFGYGITMGGFKSESIKAKSKLLEMLDGEIGSSTPT
ncbi:hypothetical protein KXD93_14670 [Mucilaginibacter sp. BJC16-A38]|uniref:hypothetical protein n=1 Tax=Mucilaginibacter phenanthrenivorans TaxID=1234842 RepID=UPI002157FF3B|nr:hypothetical protein [Mucilaginibacter phenanthrenivorans]MCR8558897.1 hypothetical protein [Mucilaginibacter phenanthrenivorans]